MNSNYSKILTKSSTLRPKQYQPPKLNGYVFTERLGSGTYATVYKAYKKSSESREVLAIKCVKKSSLNRISMENLLVEIEILKQIDHPHIVNMFDFQWDSFYIYIIMEYCAGGDLSKFISTRRELPEYSVKRFLQQIASALQLLHNHNISHMDLKPQNILLTCDEQPVLKLADFGFAQYLDTSDANALRGSPLYMAPEIIMQRHYDAKVDLWSVGVILHECLFGRAPFASKTFVELESKIKSDKPIELPSYPKISDNCKSLLLGLLQRNPEDRISFEEFFLHPFVDLEHKPSPECLGKATAIVTKAVEKDKEGKRDEAAIFYGQAIEYFVPAIYYETDKRKKEILRKKVKEYVSRAEHLLATPHFLNTENEQNINTLEEISNDHPKLREAMVLLQQARQKESEQNLEEAKRLYEELLEIMIPLLSEEMNPQHRKIIYSNVKMHLKHAEDIGEYLLRKDKEKAGKSSEELGSSSKRFKLEEDSMKTLMISNDSMKVPGSTNGDPLEQTTQCQESPCTSDSFSNQSSCEATSSQNSITYEN